MRGQLELCIEILSQKNQTKPNQNTAVATGFEGREAGSQACKVSLV